MTQGEYVPPWAGEEGHARGVEAAKAEEGKPPFEGTVGAFRIYVPLDETQARRFCGKGQITTFHETSSIKFGYLPPGMFAYTPQYAGYCEDGERSLVAQSFVSDYVTLDVSYFAGEWAFAAVAAADKIAATRVGGRDAVEIAPATPEGFGTSIVAVGYARGMFLVQADGLPLSETVKIAEAIECASC